MIEYKKATFDEIRDILDLETSFFGVHSESPPETKEGIELFLKLGGECIIQYVNNKPNGYVGIIQIGTLDDRVNTLPNNSPLKKIYQKGVLRDYHDYYFIHSWISLNEKARDLFRKIIGRNSKYHNKKLVGFCLKTDKEALKAYLRIGDIVKEITNLYFPGTVHCILTYPKSKK